MSKLNELNEQIAKLYTEFSENHEIYAEKGNKAAGGRARKALGELKKLVTSYRKASVEQSKQ